MKKQMEKRMVQKEWSKDDFKAEGAIRATTKHSWWFFPVIIAWAVVPLNVPKQIDDIVFWVLASIIIISLILFYVIEGNKYWKEMKDKQQPITIEPRSTAWWWHRKNKK